MDMLTITNACCSEFCHFLLDSNWVFFRLNFQCKITFFLSPLFLVLSFVSRFQVTGAEAQQKKGVGSIAKIVAFCLILHNIWKPNQAQACNQYITYIVHLKHELKKMICWTHGVGYSLKLNRHGFDCRWKMKWKKNLWPWRDLSKCISALFTVKLHDLMCFCTLRSNSNWSWCNLFAFHFFMSWLSRERQYPSKKMMSYSMLSFVKLTIKLI